MLLRDAVKPDSFLITLGSLSVLLWWNCSVLGLRGLVFTWCMDDKSLNLPGDQKNAKQCGIVKPSDPTSVERLKHQCWNDYNIPAFQNATCCWFWALNCTCSVTQPLHTNEFITGNHEKHAHIYLPEMNHEDNLNVHHGHLPTVPGSQASSELILMSTLRYVVLCSTSKLKKLRPRKFDMSK